MNNIQKLTKSSYSLRILTQPFLGKEHKFGTENFKCISEKCPLCEINKPRPYWLIGCIDRNINDYIIYKIYYNIFNLISLIAKNPEYGDPKKYDLFIINNISKGDYSVIINSSQPLSENDLLIEKKVNLEFLENEVSPPSKNYYDTIKAFI